MTKKKLRRKIKRLKWQLKKLRQSTEIGCRGDILYIYPSELSDVLAEIDTKQPVVSWDTSHPEQSQRTACEHP